MKPTIFIYESGNDLSNYRSALQQAGGKAVISSDLSDARQCDGLLLPGGGDIDPRRYGQEPISSPRLHPERETAEFSLLEQFFSQKKPILGICLGMQMLNVALGGTLHQQISDHEGSSEGKDSLHPTVIRPQSVLSQMYGIVAVVNSCHRQSVARLGSNLSAIQTAPDGTVEAIQHNSLPVLGVQWHPERLTGRFLRSDATDGQHIFHWLIQAARSRSEFL